MCVCSVTQLCPTLCNPMDCSPPNSSVHGIFHARILEWVSIYFWYIVGRSKREVLSAYLTVTYPSPSFLTEPDSGFGQFLAAHTPSQGHKIGTYPALGLKLQQTSTITLHEW